MELKDWQERLIQCIAQGGWQSCGQDVRKMFDDVGLMHLDEYAWEGCRNDECQAITGIVATKNRMTLLIKYSDRLEGMQTTLVELRKRLAEKGFSRPLVVGYDGDKLFVNLVISMRDLARLPNDDGCTEVNGIKICRVERDFNYVDADYEEVVVTPEMLQHGLPLRVQGDLLLMYMGPLRSLSELYIPNRDAVGMALHSLIELALVEAGLVFERHDDIYLVLANNTNKWGAQAVAFALNRVLSRHMSTVHAGNVIRFGFGSIEVSADREWYRCSVNFGVDMSRLNGVLKPLADAYYNAIKGLRRANVKLRIGNHVVEIKDTYPLSFAVPVTINVGGEERTYILSASTEGRFYADEKTVIIVRHPEHGEVYIRFTVSGVFAFGHVPHERDGVLNNTVVIRRLLRSILTPDDLRNVVRDWDALVEAVHAFGKIEVPIEIEVKDGVENALLDWIEGNYGMKRISLKDDHVVIGDGAVDVLMRYEVRGNKIIIKSIEAAKAEEAEHWSEFKKQVKNKGWKRVNILLAEDVPKMDLQELQPWVRRLIRYWIAKQFGRLVKVCYLKDDVILPEFMACDDDDCVFIDVDLREAYNSGVLRILGFKPADGGYRIYYTADNGAC